MVECCNVFTLQVALNASQLLSWEICFTREEEKEGEQEEEILEITQVSYL